MQSYNVQIYEVKVLAKKVSAPEPVPTHHLIIDIGFRLG